ncbi:MAG TPA: amidase, partial [Alphaproteobacteria bacterium]|nr:amidase [Alphaproteobacteria bacterium]
KMGTPMNPWDMETHRIPGGSSSGTAVAVASGMAPCGMGSDTGGSIRLPA